LTRSYSALTHPQNHQLNLWCLNKATIIILENKKSKGPHITLGRFAELASAALGFDVTAHHVGKALDTTKVRLKRHPVPSADSAAAVAGTARLRVCEESLRKHGETIAGQSVTLSSQEGNMADLIRVTRRLCRRAGTTYEDMSGR
jgi:hypothetical protein